MDELTYLRSLWDYWTARLEDSRTEDGGMTTETAIITAVLAGLALAVGAIIVGKVTAKAESIPTN